MGLSFGCCDTRAVEGFQRVDDFLVRGTETGPRSERSPGLTPRDAMEDDTLNPISGKPGSQSAPR